MKKNSDLIKFILLVTFTTLIISGCFYMIGYKKMSLISLVLVPCVVLAGLGLSYVVSGSRCREIEKHLTNEERETLKEIARTYGKKMGLLLAAPVGILYCLVYLLFALEKPFLYILPAILALVVGFLFGTEYRKAIKEFLMKTSYARSKGYTNSSASSCYK